MTIESWVLDRPASKRFDLYTRSNAGEVMGLPVSPLGWSLIWEAAFEPGTIDGYVSMGAFERDEMSGPSDAYGMFGGYFYLNLSAMQVLSERMPGMSGAEITLAFDAHPDMPPFEARDWHANAECTRRLADFQRRIAACELPPSLDALHDASLALRRGRPDLASLSMPDLLVRVRRILPAIRHNGELHVTIGQGGMIAVIQLQRLLARLGRLDDMAKICSGIGGVESADIAGDLWRLSRRVRRSPALGAAFDRGIDGLPGRIDDAAFLADFAAFLRDHGSRSTDEWDLAADTFETRPNLALAQIAVMARQGDEADPTAALERGVAARARLIAEISLEVAAEAGTVAELTGATKALAAWFAGRERSKNLNIRAVHEVRMAVREIAGRAHAAGALAEPGDVFMLLAGELDAFVLDPAAFGPLLAERRATFAALHDLEPPFIVSGLARPLSQWDRRRERTVARAVPGDRLVGMGCSPGRVTARARVVLDASDPSMLEPGEILVTATTNPSWSPLFLAAGAVVTEFGLFNSHASIVCRELGIPCVVSAAGATRAIPDGATVTVDGDAGMVDIVS